MRYERIQQITLNKLLDKYEKSKTFTGTNQVTQNFEKRLSELFPKYYDDAEYEFFCEVNAALKDLEKKNLVCLKMQRGDIIDRIVLNTGKLTECYCYVQRDPKAAEHTWLKEIMERFQGCAVLEEYFEVQKRKISKNQKVEYFDGDKESYWDLLKLVKELSANDEEQFIRDFSIRVFRDSKRVEKLAARASALMYQYGYYQDKESVLEECGIVRTPTYVCMKGAGVLTLGKQSLDLSQLKGDVALSTASLKELKQVLVKGRRIVTIENLTSFHDYDTEEDFVVYLGGFHNRTKRTFLTFLYEQNPQKEYWHFGDIDAGGFYILEHLKAETGIPFRSMYMDVEILQKYQMQSKVLTQQDRIRIENLQKKLTYLKKENACIEDYQSVLQFMLDNNCKLEQENVRIPTGGF